MRYPWAKLRARYVEAGQGESLAAFGAILLAEAKETGAKHPPLGQLYKRAAAEHWIEERERKDEDARVRAREQLAKDDAVALVRLSRETDGLGRYLTGLGANYVRDLEEARAEAERLGKLGPGAITSFSEALGAMRLGVAMQTLSLKLTAGHKTAGDPADDEGDGLTRGIVIVPAQQGMDDWVKQRRKGLGKDGGK